MSWFYILKSDKGRYYAGSTTNLEERLKQHIRGHTRTSKVLRTFTLAYKEWFDTIKEARERERKIKSYKSKKYIEWLINKK